MGCTGKKGKTVTDKDFKSGYKDKRILITGGLGFIGSTLAYRLVELGAEVTIADALLTESGGNKYNVNGIENRLKIEVCDIRNIDIMSNLIEDKEFIFNLAGTLSHIGSMKDPITDLEINCVAQLSMLESIRKNNPQAKIVFTGTRGQYGKANRVPVDEEHIMHPTDINGINKMAGEGYHILYNKVYGLKTCSLRLTNTFGPRHQMKHHRQGIINWFIRQLIDGEKINIFGNGEQIRDVNYVDDVVEALIMVMASEKTNGEVYNLGGTPISLRDIVEKMILITGKGEYEFVPFPPGSKEIEVGNYIADYSKIKKSIGWEPKTDIEEGLKRTFKYYEEKKEHYW